jgi:hypothetical protein
VLDGSINQKAKEIRVERCRRGMSTEGQGNKLHRIPEQTKNVRPLVYLQHFDIKLQSRFFDTNFFFFFFHKNHAVNGRGLYVSLWHILYFTKTGW